MDIRSLRVFLALADHLHFGRASLQLHLSLSAFSRSLQRLELAVGQRLFDRDNRHVELTTAGRRFRVYALEAVANWEHVVDEFSNREILAGEISVYSSVTATHAIISPILEQFRRQHPNIDIKLHTGDQADAIERIMGGTNDLAIAARQEALPEGVVFSALQYSPLRFICPLVHCSVAQALAGVDTIDAESDWQNLPLIIAERGLAKARLRRWLLGCNIEPTIYAQVAGHEAIVSMVALGLGVGVVPQLVIDNSPFRDKVRVISMLPALKDFEVGICARHRRLESPLVQAFWNVAKASYPDDF